MQDLTPDLSPDFVGSFPLLPTPTLLYSSLAAYSAKSRFKKQTARYKTGRLF